MAGKVVSAADLRNLAGWEVDSVKKYEHFQGRILSASVVQETLGLSLDGSVIETSEGTWVDYPRRTLTLDLNEFKASIAKNVLQLYRGGPENTILFWPSGNCRPTAKQLCRLKPAEIVI